VLEVGPGFGSLTLGLLEAGAQVSAVEIDARLAHLLPATAAERLPDDAHRLDVINDDAMRLEHLAHQPVALVANLPYNVAVPVLLHTLATFETITGGLVMVQLEVARRLTATPGGRVYGVPSAKLAWFASARLVGTVPPSVFWPVPNVESGLVYFERRPAPSAVPRQQVFAVIDAAFAQRRKMLRSALSRLSDAATLDKALQEAGVQPSARGETLTVEQFAAIAAHLSGV